MSRRKRPRRHWYRLYAGECLVCGRDQTYRERVYGRKPRDPKNRIVYQPDTRTYCGCMGCREGAGRGAGADVA